jgi:AmiR/NasT family two-component response regulator
LSVESNELRPPRLRDVSRPAVDGDLDRLQEILASVLQENEQLRGALRSRIAIEQAKGVLAERYGLAIEDAFQLLRTSSRNHRMRIHSLAEAVVASRETPPQITPPPSA